MTRYLYIAILILLTSCVQKKDNADKNKPVELLKQDTITIAKDSIDLKSEPNVRAIDTLSEKLKSFIPEGYFAIHASFGDANLDGVTDAVLVLGKNGENEFV